jgi:Na+-transporting NADH:ubiquinone oxidoreductase subunit F
MDASLAGSILAVGVAVGIIVVLVCCVLLVRNRLLPDGLTQLSVNQREAIDVQVGRTLLESLSDQGILLPAACGGRGNCGQCQVMVRSGGGESLPNERVHLSRKDIAAGLRLACMLTVREPIDIWLPKGLVDVKKRPFRVASNTQVTPFMTELVLEPVDGEGFNFKAGQYALIEAPPHHLAYKDFDLDPDYLPSWQEAGLQELESISRAVTQRAYSMANDPHDALHPTFVVRIALPPANAVEDVPPGVVSSWIFGLKTAASVMLTGPFGDFGVQDSAREIVLIAGGAGIAPIRAIILDQLSLGTGRKMSFWYGVRNAREICFADEFTELAAKHANFYWHAALSEPRADSDWTGHRGFIHNVVRDNYLDAHQAPEDLEYYLCGPPVMSAAVTEMLLELGVERSSIYFDDFGGG